MHPSLRAATPAAGTACGCAADQLQMVGLALTWAYIVFLAASAFYGAWPIGADGRPVANDFINFYAAGRLVLQGQASAAYDWAIHREAEFAALGYSFDSYYNWPYPPTFLFVTLLFALMPLVPAMLAFPAVTLSLYVATIRMIIGTRPGIALACGFAAVPWTVAAGQNGFLTAALVGGAIAWIERRPTLAGILLGFLTYKPHFGILFPIVLVFDRRWRVIAAAAVTAVALATASWLAFGTASWQAFVDSVVTTGHVVFAEGRSGLHKQHSLLGFVRWLGGGMLLAAIVQALLMVACAANVVLMWRRPVAFEVKGAALAVAVMLAMPYLYIYDLPVLAVPMAVLVRLGPKETFLPWDLAGLGVTSALVLIFPFAPAPTGLFATLIVAAMVARRAVRAPRPGAASHPEPSAAPSVASPARPASQA